MSKPIFAFVGGLGAQGESSLHGIASACPGQFHFRVFTKSASSDKAKALKAKYGDDISFVEGKQTDVADFDKIFTGATWAFIVTNFWDPSIWTKEGEIGKALADSAKKCGVKRLIYSTLPHAIKISGGKYSVPHFDLKAEVEQHMRDIGLEAAFIVPAFYYQNWINFFPPRKGDDGSWSITLPNSTSSFMTAYDVNETGKLTAHIVKHWDQFKGKNVPCAGDHLHPQEYVSIISEVTGTPIKYNLIPYDAFQKAAGEELAHMQHYFEDCTFFGKGDWQEGKKLVGFTSFKDWAKQNAEALKKPLTAAPAK